MFFEGYEELHSLIILSLDGEGFEVWFVVEAFPLIFAKVSILQLLFAAERVKKLEILLRAIMI